MKSMAELMKELGWSEDARQDTAKAFLKNLNQALENSPKPPVIKGKHDESPVPQKGEQLSFNFDDKDESFKKSS